MINSSPLESWSWGMHGIAAMIVCGVFFGCAGTPDRSDEGQNRRTFGPYQNLYERDFRGLGKLRPAVFQNVGVERQYPSGVEHIWQSCLDVISQYDAVPYISSDDRVAVFAHGGVLAQSYYDTIVAVWIEEQGRSRSVVHLVWLPPQDLQPADIPDLPKQMSLKQVFSASDETRRRWVTAIVAENFLAQLHVQAFYDARWKKKFQF